MEFICLDGTTIKKDLRHRPGDGHRSKFQGLIYQYLLQLVSPLHIFEQFCIPKERLFLDFFLPRHSLIIEVDGQQHSQFNAFFHSSGIDYKKAKRRDALKEQWANLNGFSLLRIDNPSISFEEFKQELLNAIG